MSNKRFIIQHAKLLRPWGENFAKIYLRGNAWQKYAKRNEIVAGNPANWLVNGRKPV